MSNKQYDNCLKLIFAILLIMCIFLIVIAVNLDKVYTEIDRLNRPQYPQITRTVYLYNVLDKAQPL